MYTEFTSKPQSTDIDFLTRKLNEETPQQYGKINSFAFFTRNNTGEVIAGCDGFVLCGAIYIDKLWVSSMFRRMGLGSSLVRQVHEYGRKNGYTIDLLHNLFKAVLVDI